MEDSGEVYSLFVFSENIIGSKVKLIDKVLAIDREFLDFAASDLDGDGDIEVVDIGREAKIAIASVRQLQNGKLKTLQTLNGYDAHISFAANPNNKEILIIPKAPTPTSRAYKWNSESKRFEAEKNQ